MIFEQTTTTQTTRTYKQDGGKNDFYSNIGRATELLQHQLFNKMPLHKCQGACCRDDKTAEGLAEKAELL